MAGWQRARGKGQCRAAGPIRSDLQAATLPQSHFLWLVQNGQSYLETLSNINNWEYMPELEWIVTNAPLVSALYFIAVCFWPGVIEADHAQAVFTGYQETMDAYLVSCKGAVA